MSLSSEPRPWARPGLAAGRGLPEPLEIVELPVIRALVAEGAIVICAGAAAPRRWTITRGTRGTVVQPDVRRHA
jgi:hypothetical protein